MVYPRVHPAPLETCGAVADFDAVEGTLTLWSHDAGAARTPHAVRDRRRPARTQDPGDLARTSVAGSATRCRSTPGYLCAIVGSMLTGRPVKWTEDRSENLTSTAFARDYVMRGEIAATRDGRILAIRTNVLADHGAFNGVAAPSKYPAGFFGVFTGSYDIPGRARHHDGRLHEQGARWRRLLLLVPHHRGRLPGRAAGRLPRVRTRDGSGRAAAAQPAAAGAVPVHDHDRLGLRLRRLRDDVARGAADRRLRRAAPRAGASDARGES